MTDLEFDAFLKKYSLAIGYLEKRLSNKGAKDKLAKTLYKDTLSGKINMNNVMMDVKLFYQGNVLSQVKLNEYINKYR